jgi:hypothetical protein
LSRKARPGLQAASAWPLDHAGKTGEVMKSAQIKRISPERALQLLNASDANYRAVNKEHVKHLAEEMSSGRWFMTYEPIIIDPVRGVVDGQHRLLAVIMSGVACDFLVVEAHADADAVAAMDTGVNRSAAVTLRAGGVKNAASIATIARAYAQYKAGHMPWNSHAHTRRVSTKVINDITKNNPHIHEIATRTCHKPFKITGMIGAMSVMAMIAHDDSPSHAFEFLNKYDNAENISDPNDPVRLLYTRMLKAKASSSMKMPTHIRSGLTAKAYNAFISGYGVGVLKYAPGEVIKIASVSEFSEA